MLLESEIANGESLGKWDCTNEQQAHDADWSGGKVVTESSETGKCGAAEASARVVTNRREIVLG